MGKTYMLYDVIGQYSLHTHHLNRELTEEEADAICTACELIVGPSRDRWLSDLEAQSAGKENKTRALQRSIEELEDEKA